MEKEFDEIERRWMKIIDNEDENGVDIWYEINKGEEMKEGVNFEMFMERVKKKKREKMI